MKLILVHGRAQGGKDRVVLKKEWEDALAYGLARADAKLPPGTTIEFPFYGDLLDELVKEVDAPLGYEINFKGANPDPDAAFRGEMIAEIAAAAGIADEDVRRELAGQPVTKGPENWEWVQATLRALEKIPGFSSFAVDAFTRDVFVYLTYPGVRAKIDSVVATCCGSAGCVVVAHSLGSIVAYNVLYKRAAVPQAPRFITVGSPLGITAVRSRIERPLRSPPCVAHWFNAYDDRDVVALVPLDSSTFDVTPAIENKSDVKNFTDNRHGIDGYLADPIVAQRIASALGG